MSRYSPAITRSTTSSSTWRYLYFLVKSGVLPDPPDESPAIGDVAQREGQQLGQGGQQHLAVLGRRAARKEGLEEHLVDGPKLEVGKAGQVREGRVEQILATGQSTGRTRLRYWCCAKMYQ